MTTTEKQFLESLIPAIQEGWFWQATIPTSTIFAVTNLRKLDRDAVEGMCSRLFDVNDNGCVSMRSILVWYDFAGVTAKDIT